MDKQHDQFDGFVLPDEVVVLSPEQVAVVWDMIDNGSDFDRFSRDSFGLANLAHECGYHARLQNVLSQPLDPEPRSGPSSPLALMKDRSRSSFE